MTPLDVAMITGAQLVAVSVLAVCLYIGLVYATVKLLKRDIDALRRNGDKT